MKSKLLLLLSVVFLTTGCKKECVLIEKAVKPSNVALSSSNKEELVRLEQLHDDLVKKMWQEIDRIKWFDKEWLEVNAEVEALKKTLGNTTDETKISTILNAIRYLEEEILGTIEENLESPILSAIYVEYNKVCLEMDNME